MAESENGGQSDSAPSLVSVESTEGETNYLPATYDIERIKNNDLM